ncbi:hypothetical protein LTR62_004153 [Meristemomyces frigidus]|uniref:Calcineurin-like phosphoesterase domain-containing protein n=1 Tax=Meristemomyces frigidus TaxID=1508187 RepID=A0AAN7TIG5_9PEZI|nr:hypothetical protein LTR62_004153 [Meristemomyces frigidus]
MSFCRVSLLLLFAHLTSSEQPSAPKPISASLREIPWSKQLNFLHTTDTHGWHAGHLQEAQYSADWGDYISFARHLRQRADDDGADLLLVDTGDRVDGNGLYDASDPKGKYTFDILKHQHIHVMTSGNHELYLANTSNREYEQVVPDFKDGYIASNLDIYNPSTEKLQPLAKRYRKFTTKNQQIRVLAFGFLFNFHGNANNTVVQPVQETIKEQWFQDAIRTKDVDLFLVAGHVPVRDSEEYDLIYKAIRSVAWDTPIAFFGGHTHIRDYRKYDNKAYGIESGRYMETIGFLSIDGLSNGKKDVSPLASPTFRRTYIDNNLYSLHHHSNTSTSTFSTGLGRNISASIHSARNTLKLDHTFGCAPQDYWLNRATYPANNSLLTLLDQNVIPDTFNPELAQPSIVITNSGALRFDIFKGPFTTDSEFLVSPFTSGFRQIKNVPYGPAMQVLGLLNNQGQIMLESMVATHGWEKLKNRMQELLPPMPPQRVSSRGSREGQAHDQQIPLTLSSDKPTLPGYTTIDDAGTDGDDTIHAPITFYDLPNCIASPIHFSPVSTAGSQDKPETLDMIYNGFIQDWVLLALRYLGVEREVDDTEEALGGRTMTDVVRVWVEGNWKCDGNE